MSDYIEIDLNTTRIRTEDIDMSITNTIPSPKVQDVTKRFCIDNRLNLSKDMLVDKENIAINPYATPCESNNCAINQESPKMLVFDRKRLTLQSEKIDVQNHRQRLLPNVLADQVPKRKRIVLNIEDGLPNFVDDLQVSNIEASKTQEPIKSSFHSDRDIGNMSTTRTVVSDFIIPGESNISNIEKTVFYGENTGNISITQAIPTNILCNEKSQKRRTILNNADAADISDTKAVSSNIVLVDKADVILGKVKDNTHFETDSDDMSMTQTLPANIIFDKTLKERNITLYDSYAEDMSMTQALSGHIIQKTAKGKINVDENGVPNTSIKYKNATVWYDNDSKDMSFTCPISNVILCQKELSLEHNNGKSDDIAVDIADHKKTHEIIKTNITDRIETVIHEKYTQNFAKETIAINPYATPCESNNCAINQESRKMLVFDGKRLTLQSEKNDVQNHRQRLLPNELADQVPKRKRIVLNIEDGLPNFVDDLQVSNIEASKTQEPIKSSFHSDRDIGNMSTTRTVVSDFIIPGESNISNIEKTVFYGENTGNISITQAIPTNILCNEKSQKRRTILNNADAADISDTKAVSSNIVLVDKADVILGKVKDNTHFETDSDDMSMTQTLPANIIFDKTLKERNITLYDSYAEDMSMTQALSGHIIQKTAKGKINVDENGVPNTSIKYKNATVWYDNDSKDMSITCPISNVILCQKELSLEHNNGKSDDIAVDIADHKKTHEIIKTNITDRIETVIHKKYTQNFAMETIAINPYATPCESNNCAINQESRKMLVFDGKRLTLQSEKNDVQNHRQRLLPNELADQVPKRKRIVLNIEDGLPNFVDDLQVSNIETSKTQEPIKSSFHSDRDIGNMSTTRTVVSDFIIPGESNISNIEKTVFYGENTGNISITQAIPTNILCNEKSQKRRTILNNANAADISDTKAQVLSNEHKDCHNTKQKEKRQTIVYRNDEADISMRCAIPRNIILTGDSGVVSEGSQATVFDVDCDMSVTEALPLNVLLEIDGILNRINTYDTSKPEPAELNSKMSIIEDIDIKELPDEKLVEINKRQTIEILNDVNIPITESITKIADTSKIKTVETKQKTSLFVNNVIKESADDTVPETSKRQTIIFDNDVDMSLTEPIKPNNEIARRNISLHRSNSSNLSIAKAFPSELLSLQHGPENMKEEHVFYEDKTIIRSKRDIYQTETRHSENSSKLQLKKTKEALKSIRTINNESNSRDQVAASIFISSNKINVEKKNIDKSLASVIASGFDSNVIYEEDENAIETSKSVLGDLLDMSAISIEDEVDNENVMGKLESEQQILNNNKNFDKTKKSNYTMFHIIIDSDEEVQPEINDMLSSEKEIDNIKAVDESTFYITIDSDEEVQTEINDMLSSEKEIDNIKAVDESTFYITIDSDEEVQTEINDMLSSEKEIDNIKAVDESTLYIIIDSDEEVQTEINDMLSSETSGLDKHLKNMPSTSSTQIQANLITSGQTDVHTELHSNPASTYDVHKQTVADEVESERSDELLEASSSLTLVGDALTRSAFGVDIVLKDDIPKAGSPVKFKQQIDKDVSITISEKLDSKNSENKKKSTRKTKTNKVGKTIAVQQFIAEYNIDESRCGTSSGELRTETRSAVEEAKSMDVISSFTSSKNLKAAHEDTNIALESRQRSNSSVMSSGCINPELVTELSSKNLITECEASVNIVAKIDMLPIMRCRECKWETSTGDVWSFLLLNTFVRLTVRLAHRHGNATRSYMRADTPVEGLSIEIAKYDEVNIMANVGVGFGVETMRHACAFVFPWTGAGAGARGRAGDLPEILRRCGAVAEVALHWCRVMYDAYMRLAYTLTQEGLLTLKVANIPLRSVWEITMRMELVVNDAGDALWPRASDVRVTTVISDYPVSEAAVSKAIANVPYDWGHVPRTLWSIFKYLKHKKKYSLTEFN